VGPAGPDEALDQRDRLAVGDVVDPDPEDVQRPLLPGLHRAGRRIVAKVIILPPPVPMLLMRKTMITLIIFGPP
jgi:hypothetical protein